MRVTKVELKTDVDAELGVLGKLGTLVPGERTAELLGQRCDRTGDLLTDGFGTMGGERRPIPFPGPVSAAPMWGRCCARPSPSSPGCIAASSAGCSPTSAASRRSGDRTSTVRNA